MHVFLSIQLQKPSNILSVVVTLIDPLLEKYPLQVVAALLLAWQTRSLMSTGRNFYRLAISLH